MAKVRPREAASVAASTALLDELGVADLRGIDIELVAAHCGAFVLYGAAESSGRSLHAGGDAIVCLPESARGTRRARFTTAHETGHLCMHRHLDHFGQCTGEAPKPGPRYRAEREAEDFAAMLLMPERTMRARCRHARPRIEHVASIADDYGTSLIATAIRYVELTLAPCAVAKIVGGAIQWALESGPYEGRIVRGRAAGSWGSAATVETAPIEGTDATLVWIQ